MKLKELKENRELCAYEISKLAKKLGMGLRNIQASSIGAKKGQTWIGATLIETSKAEFKGKNRWFPEVGYRFYVAFTFKANKFSMRVWYFKANGTLQLVESEESVLISTDITLKDAMQDMKEHLDNAIRPFLAEHIEAFKAQ